MVELPDNTPIRDLVKGLGISSPEYLLVIVNGHVPPADTPLSDGDQVMIVYPLSGG
ncbi:MAG TPA: MoaD/ThiS family protein [Firmicutes bacterium]|nr:MoaD/ThiS family protein [Bacillota bacterium]